MCCFSLRSDVVFTVFNVADLQCKLVPVFADFLDVVLQVVEEQLHHVQLLLSPPGRTDRHIRPTLWTKLFPLHFILNLFSHFTD